MIVTGDARAHLKQLPDASVDLSFWSPPYYVGKSYEQDLSFEAWQDLIRDVIAEHPRIVKPGGFLVINIADILCFSDHSMPRFQADNITRKVSPITRSDVLAARALHPNANRHQLADILGCSEQTVQRRLEGNNVRGGKHSTPTRILLTGALVADWAKEAGMYLYDQRIWHKDPCWNNSRWHSNSYRAVDEFEHVYVFWRPGVTTYDRDRLTPQEWAEWGSRGVWNIPSVRRNDRHEAEFPEELARRVIRLFCPSDGLVLDPFVGSGTTTAVAAELGCRWIGIELDPASAHIAEKRTATVTQRSATGSRVSTNSGRSPLGVAANQISPRRIPVEPILGRPPLLDIDQRQFLACQRHRLIDGNVVLRSKRVQVAAQGLTDEFRLRDAEHVGHSTCSCCL